MENISEIKSGFIDYLKDKYGDEESSKIKSYSPELSIFMYSSDFQQYLVGNGYADVSVFSKSISEIKDMLSSGENKTEADAPNEEGVNESPDVNTGENVIQNNNTNGMNQVGDSFLITALTDVVNNDQDLFSAFNTNSNGTIDAEEITAFLDSVEAAMQADPDSYETIFDGIAKGIQEIKGAETSPESILESIYESEEALEYLDLDGDGKISDLEKELFESYVQGDNEELNAEDLQKVLEQMKNGTFDYDVELPEDALSVKDIPETDSNDTASTSSSPAQSSAGSVGSSGGVSGGSYSGNTTSSNNNVQSAPDDINDMNLEQLQQERETRQANVTSAQENVDGITSDIEDFQNGDYKDAREAYEKALEEDENISEELKEKISENLDNIEKTTSDITSLNSDISQTKTDLSSAETQVDADEKNIAALESAINSYSGDLTEEEAAAKQKAQTQLDTLKETTLPQHEQERDALDEKLNGEDGLLAQLKAKEEELEGYKQERDNLENTIQEMIESNSANLSDETVEAFETFREAEQHLEELQTQLPDAQEQLSSALTELEEVDALINEKQAEKLERENSNSEFDFDFNETLTDSMKSEIEKVKQIFEENKDKYEAVEEATGIPAELVAAIHYREGSCNFDTYLHNGEPLGQTTTLVPKDVYFEDWTEAAIDALLNHGGDISQLEEGNLDSYLYYAECYNGLGYSYRDIASPYVWSGTDKYTGGMFVADGVFDGSYKDTRPGVAVIMKELCS